MEKSLMTKPHAERLALDRDTVRRFDEDGHMHVSRTPISKATVNGYFGREIPDYERLGLDAEREYKLLRDPNELARAAGTFVGKPLLILHTPIGADDHPREATIGTIGNVDFESPYLMASMTVWDGEAIGLIQTGEQKELSCGYRYTPDMTPGNYEGTPYDGVMRNIIANHVALVEKGRAGPQCVVGDSLPNFPHKENTEMAKKPLVLSRKALLAQGALSAIARPLLAQDAKIDLKPIFAGVTAKNFKAKRADIVKGYMKALEGKLATDAEAKAEDAEKCMDDMDDDDGAEDELTSGSGMPPRGSAKDADKDDDDKKAEDEDKDDDDKAKDSDPDDGQEAMDEDDDDDDDKKPAFLKKAKDKQAKDKAKDEDKDEKVDKKAMDAAIKTAKEDTRREVMAAAREIRSAEELVAPYVGRIAIACDSAPDVYKAALDILAVDIAGVHSSAYKAILLAQPKPKIVGDTSQRTKIAQDEKSVSGFFERFPAAKAFPLRHA